MDKDLELNTESAVEPDELSDAELEATTGGHGGAAAIFDSISTGGNGGRGGNGGNGGIRPAGI